MKRKEDRSTFIRPHEGLFGLREWAEEGVEYEVRFLGLLGYSRLQRLFFWLTQV